jgi:serine protease inhibitor
MRQGSQLLRLPFVVDRPFLCFIRDATGAVLFSGQVKVCGGK